ncbi:MAG: hypothetical protein JXR88_04140 [Clostridia bacterium]|nr:hypothetical protein [Clostridia bacterium]
MKKIGKKLVVLALVFALVLSFTTQAFASEEDGFRVYGNGWTEHWYVYQTYSTLLQLRDALEREKSHLEDLNERIDKNSVTLAYTEAIGYSIGSAATGYAAFFCPFLWIDYELASISVDMGYSAISAWAALPDIIEIEDSLDAEIDISMKRINSLEKSIKQFVAVYNGYYNAGLILTVPGGY